MVQCSSLYSNSRGPTKFFLIMRCFKYEFVLNIKCKYNRLSRDHNHISEFTEPELRRLLCILWLFYLCDNIRPGFLTTIYWIFDSNEFSRHMSLVQNFMGRKRVINLILVTFIDLFYLLSSQRISNNPIFYKLIRR